MNAIRSMTFAAALLVSGATQAAQVHYGFTDFWGNIFAPTSVPANLSTSDVSIVNAYGGVCWNTDLGGTNNFACGGFGSSALNFTVSANTGYRFDINSFTFQGLVPDPVTGPSGWAVYSSLDGFTNALISGNFSNLTPGSLIDYDAGLTADDLVGPFEIRIVSTGRDSLPASAWLLDNFLLDVTVENDNSVSEPGSVALIGLGLAGLASLRRLKPGKASQ
jgi:hypothetical protein